MIMELRLEDEFLPTFTIFLNWETFFFNSLLKAQEMVTTYF